MRFNLRSARSLRWGWLLIVSLCLCTACGGAADLPGVQLELPLLGKDARVARIEWYSDGSMFLDVDSGTTGLPTIWMRQAAGETWEALHHIKQVCDRPLLQYLVGDPQLLALSCITGVVNSRVQYGAFVYDLQQQTLRPLFPTYQPGEGRYFWNTQRQQGIIGGGGGPYSTLSWLTPTGTTPLTLTLEKNGKTWTMSDSVLALQRYETSRDDLRRFAKAHPVGIAGQSDWAWETRKLAFWASLAPIGRAVSLLDSIPFDLYVVDLDTWAVQSIHTTSGGDGAVHWSQDGQWLAYTTAGGGWQQAGGIYLWSLKSGKTYRVHAGEFSAIAWSPDQTQIVASKAGPELWLYDVSQIIAGVEQP